MDLVFPQASRTNAAIVGLFKYLRGEPEDHPQRTKSSETTGATLDILPTTPIEPRQLPAAHVSIPDILPTTPIEPRQLPAHVSKNQTRTVRAKAPPTNSQRTGGEASTIPNDGGEGGSGGDDSRRGGSGGDGLGGSGSGGDDSGRGGSGGDDSGRDGYGDDSGRDGYGDDNDVMPFNLPHPIPGPGCNYGDTSKWRWDCVS